MRDTFTITHEFSFGEYFNFLLYQLSRAKIIRRLGIYRGITYRFTHWGMERIGTKTEATIPWRDIHNLKETRSFFLLFVKETIKENKVSKIHVIQKRMFTSPEDSREFQLFLDQNVPL